MVSRSGTPSGAAKRRFNIHYHHGYGGGAKRSKGILGADIDQKDFPDADIIVRGHDPKSGTYPSPSTALRTA